MSQRLSWAFGAARRRAVCAAIVAVGVVGCGGSSGPVVRHETGTAQPLAVVLLPTPASPPGAFRDFHVRGRFPQVQGTGPGLKRVNHRLRAVVIADEEQSGARSSGRASNSMPQDPGLYAVFPKRLLTSASTAVVSTLLGVRYHHPGGAETDDTWISATVRARTGQPVRITQLFADPHEALQVLAASTRRILIPAGSHLAASCSQMGSLCDDSLAPVARNYATFALTESGLAVGVSLLCGASCGRSLAVIPWKTIRPYLSAEGTSLVNGVRSPSSWRAT